MKFLDFFIIFLIIASVLFAGCTFFCKPTWKCSDWTQCNIAGIQTRTCTDANSCGSMTDKPPESQTCTPQTVAQVVSGIVGSPFSVRGQAYTDNPIVPLITDNDKKIASQNAIGKIVGYTTIEYLYDQYYYRCFTLKNEGTQAYTTAQAAAAGTSSKEQLINFYNTALDTLNREENCQRSIKVFLSHQFTPSEISYYNTYKLTAELNNNIEIGQRDEDIEITNYNSAAKKFNNEISKCNEKNQVLGIDGLCYNICSKTTSGQSLYCPSESTCVNGKCLKCLPGFQLTSGNSCIQTTPQVNVISSSTPIPIQTISTSSSIDAIQLLGEGDDVKSFTVTGTELKIFSMSYSGNENFNIRLLDSEGNLVELLANEVGSYNGEKTVKLDAGIYTIYINTTGPWTLDIS